MDMDKFKMGLEEFTTRVLIILPDISDEFDLATVKMAIKDHFEKGWTPNETASKLKYLEHVDPNMEEETALKCMAFWDRVVGGRLELERVSKGL